MKKLTTVIVCFCVISTCVWGAESVEDSQAYWQTWRGPITTGVAPLGNPPIKWSEDQNIRWKIEIPGKGLASPIVWSDTVFVLTAIETNKQVEPQEKLEPQRRGRRGPPNINTTIIHKFVIFAINRQDGSILWQRTAREELPHEGTHPTGSWASNSPVTDGQHVYAHFGSRGFTALICKGISSGKKTLEI